MINTDTGNVHTIIFIVHMPFTKWIPSTFVDTSHIDSAPPFLLDTLCIGEVRLFLIDALLVDEFPSSIIDVRVEGC
jgi:hypothetical protein